MDEYLVFPVVVLISFFVLVYIFVSKENKKLDLEREKLLFEYKIQKKKLKLQKTKKKDDDDEGYEDFEESLPKWLESILEGAGVDIEGFYNGDENEIMKLKSIVSKLGNNNYTGDNDGLIG